MLETYASSFLGLWVILATIVVQAIVASVAHRRQKSYVPGIVDAALGHESFVFRSDRTFRNSLENIVPFFGLAILGVLTGYDAGRLAIVIWIYAIARIIHMLLYYVIATEKNPSPRSYFYAIGLLATLFLTVDMGRALIGAV
jgi:uncharacterized MAPEG superfamily protein